MKPQINDMGNKNDLVEEAYARISAISSGSQEKAIYEAGEYLILTFYSNDLKRARSNLPILKAEYKSLYAVIVRKRQEDPKSPAKSWVYNSINLTCDRDLMKECSYYKQLSLSHKILLLPIKDQQRKSEYAKEVIQSKLSVKALRELLADNKSNSRGNPLTSDLNALGVLSQNKLERMKVKNSRIIEGLNCDITKINLKIQEVSYQLQLIEEALKNKPK